MAKIAIIDYGIGNVKSISNALLHIGVDFKLTSNKEEILLSDGVILPGVGAFPTGMANLQKSGLDKTIHQFAQTEKPILGICLGMQLLMEIGEEFSPTKGLGLIKGSVKKLSIQNQKLPHISWNNISLSEKQKQHPLFKDIEVEAEFYFVHSYVAMPINEDNVLATTLYDGISFCSAIIQHNIIGVQFHPEKSGENGLHLLRNFATKCVK